MSSTLMFLTLRNSLKCSILNRIQFCTLFHTKSTTEVTWDQPAITAKVKILFFCICNFINSERSIEYVNVYFSWSVHLFKLICWSDHMLLMKV
uniref:Uncharacterized protein n=1 Tax=Anguilla anguilla TaxID=7936 RepID=A0A0E9WMJ9_ANGAN